MVSARSPQYWQQSRSRANTARRFGERCRGRGTLTYWLNRTTDGTSTDRRSERNARPSACSISTFSARTRHTPRRALTTASGSKVALSTSTPDIGGRLAGSRTPRVASARRRFWDRHHSSQTTMSAGDGAAFRSPYIVSVLKRASRGGGSGMNGGRRHQPPGAKRAAEPRPSATVGAEPPEPLADANTILAENTTPTPEA